MLTYKTFVIKSQIESASYILFFFASYILKKYVVILNNFNTVLKLFLQTEFKKFNCKMI